MQKYKIQREVKIGLLFAITLFLFIWGINYLRGTDIFTRQIRFHIVYDQVSGLMETNPVTISGVTVGQVSRIAFHPDGSGRVVVTATADRQIGIPVNSVARLTSEIVGTNKIIIELGTHPDIITSGDTLIGRKDPAITEQIEEQFAPFRIHAERILVSADTLLAALNQVLGPEHRQMISGSIASLHHTMSKMESAAHTFDEILSHEAKRISTILQNAESITHNLEENRETINHILQNLSETSDHIASDEFQNVIFQASHAMTELALLMEKINRGEGSAGKLLSDEELYENINRASHELELLLEDIRAHPGRYFRISVFGR